MLDTATHTIVEPATSAPASLSSRRTAQGAFSRHTDAQFVDTLDPRQLRSGTRWPITRLLAPHFVEEIELGRYMRRLLETHRWSVIRVAPHRDGQNLPSEHLFDVYGVPAEANGRPA